MKITKLVPTKKKKYKKYFFEYYNLFFCDFETKFEKDVQKVICFSIVNNELAFEYSESINELDMDYDNLMNNFMEKISAMSKIDNSIFFFHNFSKFDAIFIINYCVRKNIQIEIVSRDLTIYKLIIIFNSCKIEIRDSYLLVPLSLDELSIIFDGGIKGKWCDKEINTQNLEEIKQYCLNDSTILCNSFKNFLRYIENLYDLDPLNSLTLASLSLKIFRTLFYNDSDYPISHPSGNMDAFIRKSYRGGVVELYRPLMGEGYHYDVNSLYPYVMSQNDMPIGEGRWLTCNNDFEINKFYGFLEVEVETPHDEYCPFLTRKDEKRGLIAPLGNWIDIYFSEEIKFAITLGYKFKYFKGISYQRGKPFLTFVSSLYNERVKQKSNPKSIILKRLLNSLYGRLGMSNNGIRTDVADFETVQKISRQSEIYTISPIEQTGKSLIRYTDSISKNKIDFLRLNMRISNQEYLEFYKKNEINAIHFVNSVQIASATTSFARIEMYKYKKFSNNIIYYTDTDSIFVKNPIDNQYISETEIGKMKLVEKIKSALFVAPKIYYTINHNESTSVKMKGVRSSEVRKEDLEYIYKTKPKTFSFITYFNRDFRFFNIFRKEKKVTISSTSNKRDKVYDEIGNWIDTKPIKTNNNETKR